MTIALNNTGKGSPVPSIFGTAKKIAFSTNAQSRFASIVLDSVLGLAR